ncbi:MAG: efflux RND transporter permease subunit [Microbacteriaceae bacterium]|nr:MAG: efflux RND transporter permease subunit [Microbacteriaceae bacterium]
MSLLSVFSLRNRALIALLTIVVAIFGGYALTALKMELFPSLTLPNVTVVTTYPGASPDVVEESVSTPIETALQGIEGLEETSATSSSGVSTVQASFTYGTDLTRAEQKVELAIGRIASQLPDAVDPMVVTFSLSDFPILQLAVTSDLEPAELANRLENIAVPELEQVEGVSSAAVYGATGQRITITPNTAQLAASGLTTQAIRDALKANGTLLAAGQIDEDGKTLTVQAGTRIGSTDELGALPLVGSGLTIADVATVEITENPVTGISRVNGEPSLTLAITKTPAGNTVDVSHGVQDKLAELEEALGGSTSFSVVFDQAPFVEHSIESLATEGLLGLAFAVVVIFLFLFSVRSTLVAAISIPVSVLITFVAMLATGYSLNVLTLGAITIAIGRVVDDSIVVIENIKRHLGLGAEKTEAVLVGVREVASAITASTVTTAAVFLPIALVGGLTGELFRPFALTVTIALASSLLVALTIVPVLAYWFLKSKPHHAHNAAEAEAPAPDDLEAELSRPDRLQKAYLPVIRWTVAHPAVTLVSAVVVLGITLALVPIVPTNFVGNSGQNTLSARQTLPAGTSLDARDAAAAELEDALSQVDGIETVQATIGSSGGLSIALGSLFGGAEASTFSITTTEGADQDRIRADVQDVIDGLGDEAGEITISSGSMGFSSDIAIEITAPDEKTLREATDDVVAAMRELDVAQQVESNLSASQPYIAIQVDREKAAALGLTEVAVGGIVAEAMLPVPVGSVEFDGDSLSIYIANTAKPTTVQELRDFVLFATPLGPVTVADVATVEQVDGPASISTQRGIRTATVSVTPATADVGTASATVLAELDSLELPGGVSAAIGGVTSDQEEAFTQLGIALLAAILIVYTVMVATFRSLRQPLLLLISVPFAATGAILLQLASGIPLGVASLIGLLMLIGIVVTNAIVLIDLVNQYRDRGLGVNEALVHGASRRLRPILMTALATIFALVPMGLGLTGQGGFISQPLAIVVIGGLISSTVLTLVVLPSLYALVEGAKERREAKRAAAAPAA